MGLLYIGSPLPISGKGSDLISSMTLSYTPAQEIPGINQVPIPERGGRVLSYTGKQHVSIRCVRW